VLNRAHERGYTAIGLKSESKKLQKMRQSSGTDRVDVQQLLDIRAFGAVMSTEVNAGQVRAQCRSLSLRASTLSCRWKSPSRAPRLPTRRTVARNDRTRAATYVPYGLYARTAFVSGVSQ